MSGTERSAVESSDRPRDGRVRLPGSLLINALHQQHLLVSVNLVKLYFDDLARGGLYFASDEGRFNRQLAMPPIDEGEKLHAAGAAMIEECVERGSNRASGIERIRKHHTMQRIYVEANRPRMN